MKILITGHAGFLGLKLASNFLKKKHSVIGIDIKKTKIFNNYKNFSQYKVNLTNYTKVKYLFKKIKKIDVVIHTAAKQPVKKDENLEKYLKTNFYGTKNLLEFCKDIKVKKIIYCSSFSVYGVAKSPIKEDTYPNPKNTYGLSKYLSENLIKSFSNQFNMKVIILRLDGIYGNNQNLPGFIKASFESAYKNKEILLFKKGKLKRNQVYVDDVVKAINLALKKINRFKYEIFNIGGDKPISTFNILKKIIKITKSNSKVILSNKSLNFSQDIFLDTKKAKNLLNFKPNAIENNLKKMFKNVE